jgi:hypothetical protein
MPGATARHVITPTAEQQIGVARNLSDMFRVIPNADQTRPGSAATAEPLQQASHLRICLPLTAWCEPTVRVGHDGAGLLDLVTPDQEASTRIGTSICDARC